jgi:BON domain/AAA domain
LIEQLKKGHTVALLVDEAQALSDEILEELRLLSNLETDQEKLIQIVLMGQPELESKLDQPELRQLKQRVTLRCRLLPLTEHEVGLYIASRVKIAGYEGKELFVPEAVQKITHYSNGIPRLINVVCDNALVIASAASRKQVSAEMIDEVAHDLKLTGRPQVKAEGATTEFKLREDLKGVFRPTEARTDVMDEPWRADFAPSRGGMYTPPRNRSFAALGIGVLLGVGILAGAGIALHAQQTGSLAALDVKFKNLAGIGIKDLVGLHPENPEPAHPELSTEFLKETPSYKFPNLQEVPEPGASEPPAPEPNQNSAALPQAAKPDESAIPETTTPSQTTKSQKLPSPIPMNPATKDRPLRAPDNVAPTAEQLEFEIYKAIYNRAIRGVEVSVRDGTVYLFGRVATEQQKLAAAQAARSVPGVKEVRDQIIVNSLHPEDRDRAG